MVNKPEVNWSTIPNWSKAPRWAKWWAVEKNGRAFWYAHEPYRDDIGWRWRGFSLILDQIIEDTYILKDWENSIQERPVPNYLYENKNTLCNSVSNGQEFKAGDNVYCPDQSTDIYILEGYSPGTGFPVWIKNKESFTLDGKRFRDGKVPSIFHATPENCRKLSEFYGIEFEQPPKPKRSLNGHEYPAPESEVLKYGTEYFTPSFEYKDGTDYYFWRDYDRDYLSLKRGLIHLTIDNAKAHAEAIFSACTGELND